VIVLLVVLLLVEIYNLFNLFLHFFCFLHWNLHVLRVWYNVHIWIFIYQCHCVEWVIIHYSNWKRRVFIIIKLV